MSMQIKSGKKKIRFLSYILVITMLLSLFPMMAFADDITIGGAIITQDQEGDQNERSQNPEEQPAEGIPDEITSAPPSEVAPDSPPLPDNPAINSPFSEEESAYGPEEDLIYVTFLYPDGGGFAEYKKLLVTGGFVETPGNSGLPIPDGYVSFDGWFTESQGNPAAQRFDFSAGGIVANLTLYAHYSNEYLVQFLDGDGNVYDSVRVASGGTVSPPGSTPAFSLPSDVFFENEWKLADGTTYDFTAPVTSDLILSPVLIPGAYVIFVSYGTPVTPIFVKQGSTVGDISSWPANPTRTNYTFNHWTTTSGGTGGTAVDLSTVIGAENLMLYGNWTAGSTQYKIVYWVEKPGMFAVGASPTPGNPAHYDYGYEEAVTTGTAGETVTVDRIPAYTTFGTDHPMRYAALQQNSSPTVISGNGDTIINVYCTLKVYTLTFELGTFTPGSSSTVTYDRTMTIGSTTYGENQGAGNYTLPVKFGQNVTTTWPSPATASFSYAPTVGTPGATYYRYTSWKPPTESNSGTNQFSRINVISGDLLPTDATISSLTFTPSGSAYTPSYNIRYYAEQLPGQLGTTKNLDGVTYVLMPEYNQDNVPILGQKELFGMSSNGRYYSDTDGGTLYTTATPPWEYLFYKRVKSKLSYDMNGHGGTPIPSVPGIMYEQSLASYDADVPDVLGSGYRFIGWYKDADGIQPFDFSTETMPARDLTIYAKWEPTALTVTFLDSDGSSLGKDNTQGVVNGGSVNFNSLTIDGLVYELGLSVPGKGVFDGWDFVPGGSTAKTKFPIDLPIWENTNLYAHWKTSGFKITYEAAGGPVDGASYLFETKARVLDAGSYVPPRGNVFIGWKVKGSTSGYYYPGSVINVDKDIVFEPYTVPLGTSLVTINYHANYTGGGGTETHTMPAMENSDVPLPGESIFSSKRTGYHIIGWSLVAKKDDETPQYPIPGDDYHVTTGTVDLYAIWASDTYTITYKASAGGTLSSTTETNPLLTAATGSTATANTGYTFVNWTDEVGKEVSTNVNYVPTVRTDATFTANFEVDGTQTHTANYTINFYKDGVEVSADALSGSKTEWILDDVTLDVRYIANPTKYVGYALDVAASDTVPPTVKTSGNVYNIYYVLNAYTVNFLDWNGAVLSGPQTVSYGGSAAAPGDPTRPGYNFVGWDVAFNYITSNLTVTAVYTPIVAPPPPVIVPLVVPPVVVPPAVVAPAVAPPAPAPPAVITPTPTPLAPPDNEAEIEDVVPPLVVTEYWALLNLLLTLFTALLMIILLITYFMKKRDDDDNEKYEVKKKGVVRLLSLAVTIVAVVVFILTEDITLTMKWIDKYTLWMAVIALVQIIVMALSKKKYEDKQQQPRPNAD